MDLHDQTLADLTRLSRRLERLAQTGAADRADLAPIAAGLHAMHGRAPPDHRGGETQRPAALRLCRSGREPPRTRDPRQRAADPRRARWTTAPAPSTACPRRPPSTLLRIVQEAMNNAVGHARRAQHRGPPVAPRRARSRSASPMTARASTAPGGAAARASTSCAPARGWSAARFTLGRGRGRNRHGRARGARPGRRGRRTAGDAMKVLIVEDDTLHRAYLNEAVREALPECATVVEATNGIDGEARAREMPDAHVVMDLQMHPRNGIEAARTIWRERPRTRILFWSNYSDEAYVRGVSRIVPPGAAYGYVLKSASDERLRLALRGIFVENQCVIDGEVRGTQQKSRRPRRGPVRGGIRGPARHRARPDRPRDRGAARDLPAVRPEPPAVDLRQAGRPSGGGRRRRLQPARPRGGHGGAAQAPEPGHAGEGGGRPARLARRPRLMDQAAQCVTVS